MCFELSDNNDVVLPDFSYHYTTAQGIEGILQKYKVSIRLTNTNFVKRHRNN